MVCQALKDPVIIQLLHLRFSTRHRIGDRKIIRNQGIERRTVRFSFPEMTGYAIPPLSLGFYYCEEKPQPWQLLEKEMFV